MKAVNEYFLPGRMEDIVKVVRKESPTHKGELKNAIDLLYTTEWGDFSIQGKPVLAPADDGIVVDLRGDSEKGGPDMKYRNDGNFITIKYPNDEYFYCEHLRKDGVMVEIGDKIEAKQIIGESGNTGTTYLSHTHCEWRKYKGQPGPGQEYETLEVNFKDYEG